MPKPKKPPLAFKSRKPSKADQGPKLRKPAPPPEVGVSIEPQTAGPLDLGAIVLPTQEDALKILQELAEMNDRVLQAQKRHADAAAHAKKLRGEWDDLAAALSRRLRQATHSAPMPLFDADAAQAERDRAVKNQIVPAAGAGEAFPAADGAAETAAGAPAGEAIGELDEENTPF